MTGGEDRPRVTVEAIVAAVADAFDVPASMIHGRQRFPETALPRQAAMWLAVQLTRELYGDIGAAIGGRDRKTVRTAARHIDERIETDGKLADTLDQLKLQLAGEPAAPAGTPAADAIEAALADLDAGDAGSVRPRLVLALQELAAAGAAVTMARRVAW